MNFTEALTIYCGSDGGATMGLYAELDKLGPAGVVAINLFRAHKASARAKVYRRRFKGPAYDKKQWSMNNLCEVLGEHAVELGIEWGWQEDPEQTYHRWVLYVDLPTGQVSFHTDHRGDGPDYDKPWDQQPKTGADRICRYIAGLFEKVAA